jgi:hypothetical protein
MKYLSIYITYCNFVPYSVSYAIYRVHFAGCVVLPDHPQRHLARQIFASLHGGSFYPPSGLGGVHNGRLVRISTRLDPLPSKRLPPVLLSHHAGFVPLVRDSAPELLR